MNGQSDGAIATIDGQEGRPEVRRRAMIVAYSSVLIAVVDAFLYFLVIPWVESQDWSRTQFGNVGFALFFAMVLFTFVSFAALAAFFFSRSSYAADKWQ